MKDLHQRSFDEIPALSLGRLGQIHLAVDCLIRHFKAVATRKRKALFRVSIGRTIRVTIFE